MAAELGLDAGPIPIALAETLTSLQTTSGPDPADYPSSLVGIGCAANLTRLGISPGSVTDLSPVAELASLTSFRLNTNQPVTLAPLNANTELTELSLWRSAVPDGALTEIADLALTRLWIGETEITVLDEVLLFEELRLLSITELPIASLEPLADTQIVNLHASGTLISDLTPLTEWGPDGLACLFIEDTPVTDLSPLLEVDWQEDSYCGSCPRVGVSLELIDDNSLEFVIPVLCEMGVNVNNCLFCPQ